MKILESLQVKIFADGADRAGMLEMAAKPHIAGLTTNPTLMRKAGVTDYSAFAREAIAAVGGRSISFEVFSDDFDTMEREAREIHTWGGNTYVKIPVTNTKGISSAPLIRKLSAEGIPLNVTAILTAAQVREVAAALASKTPSIVSVFAGRIADTGRDPVPHMRRALDLVRHRRKVELLWASPRELLNIFQADAIGCHIITVTGDVLKKLALVGKDLDVYSRETVAMFYKDATAAGYQIPVAPRPEAVAS